MYDLTKFNVGKNLKELRKERKLTLDELGYKINKSKSTMYKYENGNVVPDFQTLLEISNVFNIDVNYFCNQKNETSSASRTINPFGTDKLYMYYSGMKSLIVSEIDIEKLTYQKATYYNAIKGKNHQDYRKKYQGILEFEKEDAYFTLTSNECEKFERIQIQVKIPNNKSQIFYGYIASDTSSQKCIITKECIIQRELLNKIYDELKVTKNELNNIKENNYWNFEISDEKMYRISEKELKNK